MSDRVAQHVVVGVFGARPCPLGAQLGGAGIRCHRHATPNVVVHEMTHYRPTTVSGSLRLAVDSCR